MSAYKQLQNKAMHHGTYIAYAVARDSQWTTNGHIMVRYLPTLEELKPLKDQQDHRVDGSGMVDMTKVLEKLDSTDTIVCKVQDAEDWENAAGLQLTKSTGTTKEGTNLEVSVQSVYVDYVNALFNHPEWWMTKDAVFAVDSNDRIVAVIATVNKIEGDK